MLYLLSRPFSVWPTFSYLPQTPRMHCADYYDRIHLSNVRLDSSPMLPNILLVKHLDFST